MAAAQDKQAWDFSFPGIDGEGRIAAAAKVIACTDDTAALECAATLSREAGASVEVWEGARRVGRVMPDSQRHSNLSAKPHA